MSKANPTDGPWTACFMTLDHKVIGFHISGAPYGSARPICETGPNCAPEMEANGRVLAAAFDLLAAARKLEEAEAFHLDCEECEGEELPEICGHCFPLYDDARVMRRNAIAKAEGK